MKETTDLELPVEYAGEKLKGCYFQRKIYHNQENGFAILSFIKDDEEIKVTVPSLECMPDSSHRYSVYGTWGESSRYGRQFNAFLIETEIPCDTKGMIAFLSSGMIAGVGKENARKIVEAFGEDTERILDNEPERLLEIKGIGKLTAEKIADSWNEKNRYRDMMIDFARIGISPNISARLFAEYGYMAYDITTKNPYRLCQDIEGIGFLRADEIAAKVGVGILTAERCAQAMIYILKEAERSEGHVFLPMKTLLARACRCMEDSRPSGNPGQLKELAEETLMGMIGDEELRMECHPVSGEKTKVVYLKNLWFAEKGVASEMKRILRAEAGKPCSLRDMDWSRFDDDQKDAIRKAVTENVLVITGGPGRGKSYLLNGILSQYAANDLMVLLAAPTGKAAKRMEEATSRNDAKTIHRLLEYKPGETGAFFFTVNRKNPLQGDALVIDEASMIDIELMYHLLVAVPSGMKLIIIGDADQLPSVGPGTVLKSLIDSQRIPTVRLTKIHRQSENSLIALNAGLINEGNVPRSSETADFTIRESFPEETPQTVRKLIINDCMAVKGFSKDDIQILCPQKRGAGGTFSMNAMMQELFNPSGQVLHQGTCDGFAYQLREGDRVIQTVNDYKRNIFNGDTGILCRTNEGIAVKLSNGGAPVACDGTLRLSQLLPAYALTIHKSQGSEYPCVVMLCDTSSWQMLKRNLIYTGVTRAKKQIYVVGQMSAIRQAVRTPDTKVRNSALEERLQD